MSKLQKITLTSMDTGSKLHKWGFWYAEVWNFNS